MVFCSQVVIALTGGEIVYFEMDQVMHLSLSIVPNCFFFSIHIHILGLATLSDAN